jgi:hypothetical protein
LDVAVAVVLVLFVDSLVVSGVNEALAWMTQVRAKHLWSALVRLATPVGVRVEVAGGELRARARRVGRRLADVLYRVPFGRRDDRPAVSGVDPGTPEQRFAAALRATAAVRSLETAVGGRTAIRAIPTPVFVDAVDELARDDQLRTLLGALDPRSPLARAVADLGPRVESNLERFRVEIGRWYDTQMAVVSRAYRRDTRIVMAVLGLGLAVAWNLDAFAVIGAAQRDSDLRQALVVAAGDTTARAAGSSAGSSAGSPACDGAPSGDVVADAAARYRCLGAEVAQARSLGLTTAWDLSGPCRSGRPCDGWWERVRDVPAAAADLVVHHPAAAAGRFLGWCVMAVALSFGATFWFDALKRVVGYRRVVPAPAGP